MPPTASERPAIEFVDVSYVAPGGQTVLSRLNLSAREGEMLILLGRSGSGKTTALKLVNRLLLPSAGEVRVNGVSNSQGDVIRLRRSIGYVIQDVGLFPHFTVSRNIGLVPTIEGWSAGTYSPSNQRVAADGGARRGTGFALSASIIGWAEAARGCGPGAGRGSRNSAYG